MDDLDNKADEQQSYKMNDEYSMYPQPKYIKKKNTEKVVVLNRMQSSTLCKNISIILTNKIHNLFNFHIEINAGESDRKSKSRSPSKENSYR